MTPSEIPQNAVARQIRSVQALRAVAALFVVAFHATVLWRDKFDGSIIPWANGNAGVDLFFVISGFIMVVSSQRLLTVSRGARRFLELRLIRVVPLYWLATLAKLAAIAAVPALAIHTRPDLPNIVASFLFIPSRDAAGVVRPVLDVGWTLSFEMLFYLVFATAIALRVSAVRLVTPVMACLALGYLVVPPGAPALATLSDPIVLEFVFGLVIGQLYLRFQPDFAGSRWMASLLIPGLACLTVLPVIGHWQRAAIWGGAAALCLAGAIACEQRIGRIIPRPLVRIGEASYSLYLTHGFVLPLVGMAAAKAHMRAAVLGSFLIAASLAVSTVLALVTYRYVETPITQALRRWIDDRGRTVLAAPQTPI